MPDPFAKAEVLSALAEEIRVLLRQTPLHQNVVAVPFSVEEGLHEAFEGFLADEATGEDDGLGGLWKNRRPRAELDDVAAKLDTRAAELGGAATRRDDDEIERLAPPAGHVPAGEIFEEFPDVASSLGKLLRLLAENPAIGRHGSSPLRLTVHLEDFTRFAARARGTPGAD